jgi:hypothetical protein
MEESTIISDLRSIGMDVRTSRQQERVDFGAHVSGSIDAIIENGVPDAPRTRHIAEFKTHSKKSFDELEKNPQPQLELNINSNFGIKPVMIDRLVEKVNNLLAKGAIKDFKIFTSIDTWGESAEYIRTGLNLEIWERNLDTYLTKTQLPITFMCTFNILTVTNFQSLLEKILEWREKYNGTQQNKWQRIRFDTPFLKEPLQYDMNLLPKKDFMPYMYRHLEYIKTNLDDRDRSKFSELEYEKFLRVVKYMETSKYSDDKLLEGWRDFYNWFTEYDRRRGTNFVETFPELSTFYFRCMNI